LTEVKIMHESVLTKTTLLVPSETMKARALSLKWTPAQDEVVEEEEGQRVGAHHHHG
jgi:hypothetical protein